MTKSTLPAAIPGHMTDIELKAVLFTANEAARKHVFLHDAPRGMTFCGFAWAQLHCRKNHKLAKVLIRDGWKWDDYVKAYSLRPRIEWTNTQCMDYKERLMRVYTDTLKEHGIRAGVLTRAN